MNSSLSWLLKASLLLFCLPSLAKTIYKLEFKSVPPLDLTYQVFELSPLLVDKVGTNGSIKDIKQLDTIREFKNGEIQLSEKETKIIGLVVKSKSNSKADFFVDPHEIHPAAKALDFKFDCLCYHHAYHLEKDKMWYRIMKLTHSYDSNKSKVVILKHEFQPWKEEVK
jgi:hypothetical protein